MGRLRKAVAVAAILPWASCFNTCAIVKLPHGRLPVLATDAGGTRELLRELPGALLEQRDVDAIAARWVTALRSPPDRELLRAHARSFGWEVGLDALEALLRTATGDVR